MKTIEEIEREMKLLNSEIIACKYCLSWNYNQSTNDDLKKAEEELIQKGYELRGAKINILQKLIEE